MATINVNENLFKYCVTLKYPKCADIDDLMAVYFGVRVNGNYVGKQWSTARKRIGKELEKIEKVFYMKYGWFFGPINEWFTEEVNGKEKEFYKVLWCHFPAKPAYAMQLIDIDSYKLKNINGNLKNLIGSPERRELMCRTLGTVTAYQILYGYRYIDRAHRGMKRFESEH